jgi:hypothetical protein
VKFPTIPTLKCSTGIYLNLFQNLLNKIIIIEYNLKQQNRRIETNLFLVNLQDNDAMRTECHKTRKKFKGFAAGIHIFGFMNGMASLQSWCLPSPWDEQFQFYEPERYAKF